MQEKPMNYGRSDIGELERAVNTLVHRPGLIRREYWTSEVERLLGRTDITARDRQRLHVLHGLLVHATGEGCVHLN